MMEFVFLLAIFLTSSGFLVDAAVTPKPSTAVAPPAASVSVERGTIAPQQLPQLSGLNAQPAGS
ncbi:hypothetical protein ACFQ3P_15285 [Paraburkholderia sabiae]|jgi:hypothetical protein|uniref:Uncharacterized protein n=1 Tax=Paraburkholderia sabiae TaxID=273251 RepID=A0ABU9Q7V5_9BURK|nr:hypothetical protein [Paraburkholderia sabiae]WJZ77866.1 hypothetical protein QEN71_38140 [Paraburkholderia sabiae]